ncbi:hypothetical protein J9100_000687 [Vibrio vulnificus]|nr:hypothetical protein [Vibrio vulnificus]
MIKSILSLSMGTALVKAIPIIFSYVIAENYGSEAYTQFISFLLSANVIVNISVLGVVPQIISRGTKVININQIFVPLFIVFILFFLGILSNSLGTVFNSTVLLFYVTSMVILYLIAAFYNSILRNKNSVIIWMASGVLGVVMSLISYFYDIDKSIALLLFVSSFSIVAVLSVVRVALDGFSFKGLCLPDFKITLVNSVFISLFGFSVVFSFYYAQSNLQEAEKFVFSVFYQFFTLVTFIPTVIGNIVIPRLVQGSLSDKAKFLFPLVYFLIFLLISVFSLLVLYFFMPLSTPGLESFLSVKYEMLVLWVSAFLAVVSTYRFQTLMSSREFKVLFKLSLAWGSLFFSVSFLLGDSLMSFSLSLLSCYLLYALFLFFIERKKNGKTGLVS